ncbi:MAG: hypothetical protein NZM10_04405 [Fimbriimonadales bacterium]|nr:hypothetical protein [Fimbriimonadales bacterium]
MPSPYFDPEWGWLLGETPERLCILAQNTSDSVLSFLASEVLLMEHPDNPCLQALLWEWRKDSFACCWLQLALHPTHRPVLERIAFEQDPQTLPEAIACALAGLLLHKGVDFPARRRELEAYLRAEDEWLCLTAAGALATFGHRGGTQTLAVALRHEAISLPARNIVSLVYIESPYSKETFPLAIERGLLGSLRELMGKRDRLAVHGVLGTLEILLTKPLRPETRQSIAQLLSKMKEQKAAFYAGVLKHLYHFLTEQPWRAEDGRLYHLCLVPHGSNKNLAEILRHADG